MRIGYQGEALSYSDQAVGEMFPEDERVGFPFFRGGLRIPPRR